MKKAFIWVSGLCFIDKKNKLMARNFFWLFTENNPVRGTRKTNNTNNIPDVNWLKGQYRHDQHGVESVC